MAFGAPTSGAANQLNKLVACNLRWRVRTGLPIAASTVALSRCHAGQAHAWSFGAPDRAITVPDANGRTFEGLAGWDNRGGEQE